MKSRKNKKGFTLVELVVVIAIIAILGAVSVVGYLGFINKADQSAADTEATQIRTVLLAGAADPESGFKLEEGNLVVTDNTKNDAFEFYETSDENLKAVLGYYFKITEQIKAPDGVKYEEVVTVETNTIITGIRYTTAKGFSSDILFK